MDLGKNIHKKHNTHMKIIYYLKTCDTCKRILRELKNINGYTLQDIKKDPVTEEQLEEMKRLAGSYEALFSRRATLYKQRGLKDVALTEDDFKDLLLEHYTFLSRPVIIDGETIFVGNSKATVQAAIQYLSSK